LPPIQMRAEYRVERRVLAAVMMLEPLSTPELAAYLRLESAQVKRAVRRLIEASILVRAPEGLRVQPDTTRGTGEREQLEMFSIAYAPGVTLSLNAPRWAPP